MMDKTSTDKTVLLSCPFCGSTNVAQGASREMISVWCFCGAQGPSVPFPEINAEPIVAIHKCFEAWNHRASSTQEPAGWQMELGGRKIAERPDTPDEWRKIIDDHELWKADGADGYNVAADRLARLIAFHKGLRAASIPTPERSKGGTAGVRIKPLVWGKTSYGKPEVETVVGVYRVFEHMGGGWGATFRSASIFTPDGRANFATEHEAKAAAQADYEQRIKSALEP